MNLAKLLPGIFIVVSLTALHAQTEDIKHVPIEIMDGYGPIKPVFALHSKKSYGDSSQWKATDLTIRGVPKSWKNPIKRMLWMDSHQFLYQNYHQGNITQEFYQQSALQLQIDTVAEKFLRQPINCFVYFIFTALENGEIRVKVDSNNNLDFSDEKEFSPRSIDWGKTDLLSADATVINYQVFSGNEIIDLNAPLVLLNSGRGSLYSNLAQHATAIFNDGISDTSIKIIPLSGYRSPMIVVEDPSRTTNYEHSELLQSGEYIKINGKHYQNLGVDIGKRMLKLREIKWQNK